MQKQNVEKEVSILTVRQGRVDVCVLGKSPLIYHAMSEKARRELLMPKGRKTAADRAGTLKHEPIKEYRDSVYRQAGDDVATRLVFPSAAFKKAMANAALRLPGAKKTEIGQLVWVNGAHVDMYGVPHIFMAVVRSSDMNRTPDIRTRAIVPTWACRLSITYIMPMIRDQQILNLLAAAGLLMGVGDGRQEKGAMSYGQFDLVSDNDPAFLQVVANGGREAQDAALRDPVAYDEETQKMLSWYDAEVVKLTGRAKDKEAA